MTDKHRRMVVLIADDEPVTRVLLFGMLSDSYQVITAVDGRDALAKYFSDRPDILLLDVQMPGLDGCVVCERIREHEGDGGHVPILLMSAQSQEDQVLGGLARGADDFVLKPINQRVLRSKIRAQLVSKSSRDDLTAQRERLLALQQETAREHFAASAVLRNILDRAELKHPSIRTMLTPMSGFDGDVALVSKLPGGNLRIMVCDVVGHGLPAALGTIPIAVLFYSTARQGMELGAAMLRSIVSCVMSCQWACSLRRLHSRSIRTVRRCACGTGASRTSCCAGAIAACSYAFPPRTCRSGSRRRKRIHCSLPRWRRVMCCLSCRTE